MEMRRGRRQLLTRLHPELRLKRALNTAPAQQEPANFVT
jgi:hypothetical protein